MPPPGEHEPEAAAPVAPDPEAVAPSDDDPDLIPIAPPEPAEPPRLPPEPTTAPPLVEAEPGRAPLDPPEAMDPPPVDFEADDSGVAAHAAEVPIEGAEEQPSGAADPVAPAGPQSSPVAEDPQVPETVPGATDAAPLQPESEPYTHGEPAASGEPDSRAGASEPGPHPPEEAGSDLPAAGAEHDAMPEEQRPGHPIPGLPEPPGPEEREGLPDPPRRVRAAAPTPMRRAFRRAGDTPPGTGAAALVSDGRSAPGGRHRSRWIAVLALLVIGIVVAVLLYSLKGSSSHPTAKAPPEIKVLIPEGKTRLQIAQIASAAGLTGSYRVAARSSPLLNPTQYGAPKGTKTLEGFLFPATYDMDKGAPAQRLVEAQLTAFQENFSAEYASRAKALGLTSYELLTVASMIEREAQVPSDRAKIAAVIYNRLKAGIPIGIDAAIYYAIENARNIPTYTKELSASDLQIDSAYNTRTHKGLPPTPISNPGVASIQAAAHPAHASYLYYVAGADGCGEQVFSTTEAKFNEDVAAYEAAKRANGGHLPACKHH